MPGDKDKAYEDWKMRKEFEKELQSKGISESPTALNEPDELTHGNKDLAKAVDKIKKAGYSPRYAGRPLRIGLMRKFGDSGLPVVLQWIDLPLHTERAQWRHEKEYVIDPRNSIYHDHKAGKSVILYDMDKNLPLMGEFQDQPNAKSSDLQAIYGVKESFRQFIAGIRQEVNRNVRQTVVIAIIFTVSGFILGHFL